MQIGMAQAAAPFVNAWGQSPLVSGSAAAAAPPSSVKTEAPPAQPAAPIPTASEMQMVFEQWSKMQAGQCGAAAAAPAPEPAPTSQICTTHYPELEIVHRSFSLQVGKSHRIPILAYT
eukprot:SAG11_NODE_8425_length_1016_cov_5.098146_1_plen_118_part_00